MKEIVKQSDGTFKQHYTIKDDDVLITEGYYAGRDLHDALHELKEEVEDNKASVAWIYRYGGTGGRGNGGGGGGDSAQWSTVLTRKDTGAVVKDAVTLNLGAPGNFQFGIQVYRGGDASYKIECNFVNGNGQQTSVDVISKDQSFYWQKQIYLDINGTLSITVLNQDTMEVQTYSVPYIVSAYNFSLKYVYKDTKTPAEFSNNNVFMSNVKNRGLLAALEYSVAVELNSSGYSWTDWNGTTFVIDGDSGKRTAADGTITSFDVTEDKMIKSSNSGTIYLDLIDTEDILDYLNDNENAKYRQFFVDVNIILSGNSNVEEIEQMSLKSNLIPAGMYLKVYTDAGTLYDSSMLITGESGNIIQNNYPESGQFNLGSAVFDLTPYYGSLDTSRKYNLTINIDDTPQDLAITQLSDQNIQSVPVSFVTSGEHKIDFIIQYGSESYTATYYIFVKASTSRFEWYPANINPTRTNYYRRYNSVLNLTEDGNTAFKKEDLISMNTQKEKRKFKFNSAASSSYNEVDQLITVSIQYSSINDIETPIVAFRTGDNFYRSIVVYQDKIVLSSVNNFNLNDKQIETSIEYSQSSDIYVPLAENFGEANLNNFHQISIYKKFEFVEGNNYWKTTYVYIDGVLEAVFKNLTTEHSKFVGCTMFPGNYYINCLEYSEFDHSDASTTTTWLEDTSFLCYYYSYYEKVLSGSVSTKQENLYNAFSLLGRDEENFITANATAINNIALNSDAPVCVLNFTDMNGYINASNMGYNKDNFRTWMTTSYAENDEIEKLPVTVQWSNGDGSALRAITMGDGSQATFSVTPQGSSTLGYRCKNFELYAPISNDEDKTFVYTPNFNPNDVDSFLPEESFTLKADVVDSSHSNNNAMGAFVNDVTTPFAKAQQPNSMFGKFIKNCLTGFPILLFLHTRFKTDASATEADNERYYFLGIYNMNLGRKSYFNLGYKDLGILENIGMTSGFNIYEIHSEENILLRTVEAAEIQGNNNYFDFSQYDSSILYSLGGNDKTYMWGDFVDGVNSSGANTKNSVQEFCRRTALAGGYAFKTIGKNFSSSEDDNYGYDKKYSATDEYGVPLNRVPNYLYQARRTVEGTTNKYTFQELPNEATQADLRNYLVINEEDLSIQPAVDYSSLCEYYTVCMAFGLVDSVQKNMNIKSWDSGNSFYLAFYDMDTCLGVSNSGSRISYFAFSDYWQSSSTDSQLNPAIVYRDYSPSDTSGQEGADESKSAFFDIPSSYLFAVAKYAKQIFKNDPEAAADLILDPANLWALWRNNGRIENPVSSIERQKGCLSNADYFLDKYYTGHLNTVPTPAFNANYRFKYLVRASVDSHQYDETNFAKFYGRKVYYTRNWLKGRLHILDAYFNINAINDVLYNGIAAPTPNTEYIDNTNEDIYVLKDIFSDEANGNQYIEQQTSVTVSAESYAPLIMNSSNFSERYLFPEIVTEKVVPVVTNGNQYLLLGGSALWKTLNTINPFITKQGKLRVHSDYLKTLYGTGGACNSWDITGKALQTISFTNNANYKGPLNFVSTGVSQSYPDLSSVNISGTNIEFKANNVPLTTFEATNMLSGSVVDVTNVSTLKIVNINGFMSSLTMQAWKWTVKFPTNYDSNHSAALNCKTMNISSPSYKGNTLEIRNNNALTTLTVTDFNIVRVYGCPLLDTININDTRLKELTIELGNVTTEIPFSINSTIPGVVDLSNMENLQTFTLKNSNVEKIILPNHSINFSVEGALSGNRKLKYISGNGGTAGYRIINGKDTFKDCDAFTFLQKETEEGDDPLFSAFVVDSACTNMSGIFNISNSTSRGSLDLLAVREFLNKRCVNASNVTTLENAFNNQLVNYDWKTAWYEYISWKENTTTYLEELGWPTTSTQVCSLSLRHFTKCTNFNYVFRDCAIDFFNKYIFYGAGKDGASVNVMIAERSGKYGNANTRPAKFSSYIDYGLQDHAPTSFADINTTALKTEVVTKCTYDSFEYIIGGNINARTFYFGDFSTHSNLIQVIEKDTAYDPSTPTKQHPYPFKRVSEVEVAKLFHPTGATTEKIYLNNLQYFNFDRHHTLNFKDTFDYHWGSILSYYATLEDSEMKTKAEALWGGSYTTNVNTSKYGTTCLKINGLMPTRRDEKVDQLGLEPLTSSNTSLSDAQYLMDSYNNGSIRNVKYFYNLFHNIQLGSLNHSFAGLKIDSATNDNKTRVDMGQFIQWGNIVGATDSYLAALYQRGNKLTTISGDSSTPFGMEFDKYISLSDFNKLWLRLINFATSLTSMGPVFKNCVITGTNPSEFYLYGETSTPTRNSAITTFYDTFNNCVLSSEISGANPYSWNITSDFFKYFPNLKILSAAFRECYFAHTIPFNFFRKRASKTSTVYTLTGNEEQVTTEEDVLDDEGNPTGETVIVTRVTPTKATLQEYTYSQGITDVRNCFYNTHILDNSCFDLEASYNKDQVQRSVLKINNVVSNIDRYMLSSEPIVCPYDANDLLGYTVKQGTEITDAENIESDYDNVVTHVETHKVNNVETLYDSLTNYQVEAFNGTFVSPDIMYGCASNVQCTGMFCNDVSIANDTNTFTGTIPKHMMKNNMGALLTNMFSGIKITPEFMFDLETVIEEEEYHDKYYLYVPLGFTNSTNLDSVFDFRLILPDGGDPNRLTKKHYYMYFMDQPLGYSLNRSTTTIDNSMPKSSYREIFYPGGTQWINWAHTDSGIRLHVMGTVNRSGSTITGVEDGIDLSYYKSMKLDNLLTSRAYCFLYGDLFKQSSFSTWSKNTYLNSPGSNYLIKMESLTYGGLGYGLRLNLPAQTSSHFLYCGPEGAFVNKNSIITTGVTDAKWVEYYPNIRLQS